MRRILLSLVAILPLLLLGCATDTRVQERFGPPGWLEDEETRFPGASHFRGRGEADAAEPALAKARAALAADVLEALPEDAFDALPPRLESLIGERAQTERWRDGDGREYALVALPREEVAEVLADYVEELDAETETALASARDDDAGFARLRAAQQALTLQEERARAARLLAAVSPGQELPPRWQRRGLERERDALVRGLELRVESRGAHGELVEALLTEVLRRSGVRVSDQADYALTATLAYDSAVGDEAAQAGDLELVLLDPEGMPLGSRRWSLEAMTADPGAAVQELAAKAGAALEDELTVALVELAE